MTSSNSKKPKLGYSSPSSSRKENKHKNARRLDSRNTFDSHHHQHNVPTLGSTSNLSPNTSHIPLTQYAMHRNDGRQTNPEGGSAYNFNSQQMYTTHLNDGLTSLDGDPHPSSQEKPTQDNTGMTPMEHFQSPNTSSYQQHSLYIPVIEDAQSSFTTIAYEHSRDETSPQYTTSNGCWDGASSVSQGGAYRVLKASYFTPAPSWEHDLTGVGSQFNNQPCGEYDHVFRIEP